jgi:DNA-binding MarR family transcriptional regulator
MTSHKRDIEGKASKHLKDTMLRPLLGFQIALASVVANRIYEQTIERLRGLHRLEYSILMLVLENPGCTASGLAKELGISLPNMVLWLDRVSSKGLIEREPNRSDRRSNHLRLTAAGVGEAKEATAALLAAEATVLDSLSVGERAILLELLHKVAYTEHGKRL